jgi:hypothetical protein
VYNLESANLKMKTGENLCTEECMVHPAPAEHLPAIKLSRTHMHQFMVATAAHACSDRVIPATSARKVIKVIRINTITINTITINTTTIIIGNP